MGQTRIVVEQSGGGYKIPCLVNGARMKMVFDTGASTFCLSRSIAEDLFEKDYILDSAISTLKHLASTSNVYAGKRLNNIGVSYSNYLFVKTGMCNQTTIIV